MEEKKENVKKLAYDENGFSGDIPQGLMSLGGIRELDIHLSVLRLDNGFLFALGDRQLVLQADQKVSIEEIDNCLSRSFARAVCYLMTSVMG